MGATAMTDAEADVEAARLVLAAMIVQPWRDQPPEVMRPLDRIFRWLRRRLVNGDKSLAKAMDRETGHQVKLPDGAMSKDTKALKKAVERRAAKTAAPLTDGTAAGSRPPAANQRAGNGSLASGGES